jgi:hypothetical protein
MSSEIFFGAFRQKNKQKVKNETVRKLKKYIYFILLPNQVDQSLEQVRQ